MQSIPLAVLKHEKKKGKIQSNYNCMQSIPLAVLKLAQPSLVFNHEVLHAIHTACGIETIIPPFARVCRLVLHAIHTACGIETISGLTHLHNTKTLHAIHTACGIETEKSLPFLPFGRYCMQSIPLAVLKLLSSFNTRMDVSNCMQSIPLAVLKQNRRDTGHANDVIACNPYRLRY